MRSKIFQSRGDQIIKELRVQNGYPGTKKSK